jgi:hypothetical protein
MEVLKRAALLLALVFLVAGCEYFGFDGYINQLEELGITHDLADAVRFDQHLTSRPREFQGKVYVLGTRGVFVMDADRLSSYSFYPYTNSDQLDYHSDYWDDRLPPINCYLRPEDGRVVISSLNSDRGLRYGDTLTLYEDPARAVYVPLDPGWADPPVTLLRDAADTTHFAVTDLFNDWDSQDSISLWPDSSAFIFNPSTPASRYVQNRSFRTSPDGYTVFFVAQEGIPFTGEAVSTLTVYSLTAANWNTMPVAGSVFIGEGIRHDEPRNSWGEFISGGLDISTNGRYLLAWGDSFSDEDTMLIYDYTTGERMLKASVPGSSSFPELAESGMTIYTSSIRGGVAKYVY